MHKTSGGIYVASNLKHRPYWLALRDAGYSICSTWIDKQGKPADPQEYAELWQACIAEASSARVLLLYQEPGDSSNGALVEAGAALGNNVPIIYYGPNASALSFLKHPLVTVISHWATVLAVLETWPRKGIYERR